MSFNTLVFSYRFICRYGVKAYLKKHYLQIHNKLCDLYYSVETEGFITPNQLGIAKDDSIEYLALNYYHIKKSLSNIPIPANEINLLDYGCGKGRVLVVAARYNYRKAIGVEVSSLVDHARHNINSMRGKRTKDIQIIQQDAVNYVIPDDINVIYFFNPFIGQTLTKVINNIELSLAKKPRKIYIIYFNNQEFDKKIMGKNFLRKKQQINHNLGVTCGIYFTIINC